jgi:hypothetical protein
MVDEAALADALAALGDRTAEPELRAICAAYQEADRLARHAPKVADLTATLAGFDGALGGVIEYLDRLGPFEHHILRALDADALRAAVQAGQAEVRAASRRVRSARLRLGAGGPLKADALFGDPPRWALVKAAGALWTDRTGTPASAGGRFLTFVSDLAVAAGCPAGGLPDLIRRETARETLSSAAGSRPAEADIQAA